MAEEAKVPEEAAQRSKIWLLTLGSRGDTEPAIALSLGLQEKGHTVRVLGPGYMARTFGTYGIDFETADGAPLRYTGNKVARACLQDLAAAEGFLGEGNVDDYLLDTCLLYQAFFAERILKCHADGVHFNQWKNYVEADGKKFDNFQKTEIGAKELPQMRRQYMEFLAEVADKRAKSNELHAATRRESVLRSLKVKARELHRHPVDVLFRLNMCMNLHLLTTHGSEAAGTPTSKAEMMVSELGDFTKWRVEEDFDFEEWWQHWWSKLVPLHSELELGISILRPQSSQGLLLTMDAAAPEDRPDLLICHFAAVAAAVALKSRHMVSTLIWWPQLPEANANLSSSFCSFLGDVLTEGLFLGMPGPLHARGPFEYIDVMQGPRQMISFSPTFLSDEAFGGEHGRLLRSCCTGSLVLENKPNHQAGLFSTFEEESLAAQFLALGEEVAPVYVGFGSMAGFRKPEGLAALVAKSLRLTGLRGIFVAGYSGLDRETFRQAAAREFGSEAAADSRLLWLASAPHAWLFERCSCTVHHGGMGTCNAALRAGVPTVVAPLFMDQPRNAAMIRSLGCGAVVSNVTEVTPEELASAIKAVVGDGGMKARAKEVAAALRAEKGLETAVEIVERCLREPEPAPACQCSKPPLKNGSYRYYGSDGNPTLIVTVIQDGKVMMGDNPIAWFRSGSFTFEGRQFNAQSCDALSRTVTHGNVHSSGLTITYSHGAKLVREGSQGWSWLIWVCAPILCVVLAVLMTLNH